MQPYQIAVIVGSLRKDSFNRELADALARLAPAHFLLKQLRSVLAYLDMPTLGQPEVFTQAKEGLFDEAGNLAEGSGKFLQGWLGAYVVWVKKHAA